MNDCIGFQKYHSIETRLDTKEVAIEFCKNCKKEFFWRKSKRGRIDNENYLLVHKKEMLQPGDKDFKIEYGDL